MFNALYVRLDLLDDSGLPLCLLGRAAALVDLLGQPLDVPLGVQQVRVVRVILWRVLEQILEQTTQTQIYIYLPSHELLVTKHRMRPLCSLQRVGWYVLR